MTAPILKIKNLTTCFATHAGVVKAVDNASLDLGQGETLAIVGESGCGKTVLALSIMGLIPDPPGRITEGQVLYRGQDLLLLNDKEMQKVRGNRLSMIFQEPMTSLNPVFRIGDQISETLRLHKKMDAREAREAAIEALKLVGITNPQSRVENFPHELSGGMRQRVMIAMALVCSPEILIADEPTTALDVTIQSQILRLLDDLKKRMNGSLLLITHDLGVVARVATRVAVMYAGQVVESALLGDMFKEPLHPYTHGLLASVPRLGSRAELIPVPGNVPALTNLPSGCRFHPRCSHAFDLCREQEPQLLERDGRRIRCWLHT
ncbi:ABC transporter ATP-binding protein [Maridesulfovibrio sp. FT414]|uniref:ABC transporter ATP-binding protein n=1 Tax=Maridesulfovibrio sp. FT414 TaxID=2979469 RepID=UPI003D804A7E